MTTKKATPAKKKAAPKASAKKSAKASPKKKASPKATANGAPKEKPLFSKPQVRILKALLKHGELSRKDLTAKAPVDNAMCTEYIGTNDPDTMNELYDRSKVSLAPRGLVEINLYEEERQVFYQLTAKGKAAAKKL